MLPGSANVQVPHPEQGIEIHAKISERPNPQLHPPESMKIKLLILPYETESHNWQLRQLLLCQPPVQALEIVLQVNRRAASTLEFRAIITRPDGLRMGFLYDAIRYCHEVERSSVELLWDRETGDLTDNVYIYPDGSGFKKGEDKPCLTIWGKNLAGFGGYEGLT